VQQTSGMVGELLRVDYAGGAPEKVQLPFQGSVSIESSDERIPGVLATMASWVRCSSNLQLRSASAHGH
jgi:hypothetical protein